MKTPQEIIKRADIIFSTKCYNELLARGEIEKPDEYTLEVHLSQMSYSVYNPSTPALVEAILEALA
jgi:hypothetical protein